MPDDSDLLFVYGSLLSSSSHLMAQQLATNATLVGQGYIRGSKYRIDWYPGLVPNALAETVVAGEVYRLHAPAALLPLLDTYEEAEPWRGAAAEFRRELLPVTLSTGNSVVCWIYVYNQPVASLQPW